MKTTKKRAQRPRIRQSNKLVSPALVKRAAAKNKAAALTAADLIVLALPSSARGSIPAAILTKAEGGGRLGEARMAIKAAKVRSAAFETAWDCVGELVVRSNLDPASQAELVKVVRPLVEYAHLKALSPQLTKSAAASRRTAVAQLTKAAKADDTKGVISGIRSAFAGLDPEDRDVLAGILRSVLGDAPARGKKKIPAGTSGSSRSTDGNIIDVSGVSDASVRPGLPSTDLLGLAAEGTLTKSMATAQRIAALEADIADVRRRAAGIGPVRTRTAGGGRGSYSASPNPNLAKAAEYHRKADETGDPALAEGYRQLAEELEDKPAPPTQPDPWRQSWAN